MVSDGPDFSKSHELWRASASPPVVIGVAGGSGSGKTTVVGRIVESIGTNEVIVLEHDLLPGSQ